jgi:hypothetical protein
MKEVFTKIIDNSVEVIKTTKNPKFCFKIILLILISIINFKLINNILCNELNNISQQNINISISNKYLCKFMIFFILFIIFIFINLIQK